MDLNKAIFNLNEVSERNELLTFCLRTTGFSDSIGLLFDGQDIQLYSSECDSYETEGDLHSILYHRLAETIKDLEQAKNFIEEYDAENDLLYSVCPACMDDEYIWGLGTYVKCNGCGESYKRFPST